MGINYKNCLNRSMCTLKDCSECHVYKAYLDGVNVASRKGISQQKANQIVRAVFYANLSALEGALSDADDSADGSKLTFHVGRIIGKMQCALEKELAQLIDENDVDADIDI